MVERAPLATETPTAATATAREADSLAIPWPRIALAVLGLRLLITLVGAGIVLLLPQAGRGHGLQALLLDPWRHFDALWFTQIAAHGYGAGNLTTAYLPVYPLLIRLASPLTGGHLLTAALLVSNLGCPLAVGLIWRWAAEGFGTAVAWRVVILLLLFPDGFFLLGAYSESVFLALSAGTLLALRHERPLLAGVLATLATLTRLQGLVLLVPLALHLRSHLPGLYRPHRGQFPAPDSASGRIGRTNGALARGLLATVLPALGFWLYQRVLVARLGGGAILDAYSRQWHIPLQPPWGTIWQYVTVIRSPEWHLFHSPRYNYILLWYLLIALFSLGVLLASYRRLGWELTLFGVAGWCFLMTRWYSTGRYLLSVLPFFLAMALWADSDRRLRWLCTASALLLVFYTAEFAQNSWVD